MNQVTKEALKAVAGILIIAGIFVTMIILSN